MGFFVLFLIFNMSHDNKNISQIIFNDILEN